MRECATPAIRCSPGRAVGPPASSGPTPVAASRGRPPPGTISDPPWFPYPSPFVWLFCKTKKPVAPIKRKPQDTSHGGDHQKRSSQSSITTGVACKRRKCIDVTQHSLMCARLMGTLSETKLIRFKRERALSFAELLCVSREFLINISFVHVLFIVVRTNWINI